MKNNLHFIWIILFSITFLNISNAQWSSIPLLKLKVQHAIATHDNKVYIGPGNSDTGSSGQIEVFDLEQNDWVEVYESSIAGAFPVSVFADGYLFIAGGVDFATGLVLNGVDILNVSTGNITNATLSAARLDIGVATVGNKVIFAGGMTAYNPQLQFSDAIDIYDLVTGEWSTATLSEARNGMAVAVAGDLVVFAGGHSGDDMVSDVVDIYNSSTDTWSTASLSIGRAYVAGAALGDSIFIAGGMYSGVGNSSDVVDIYNTSDGTWSAATLSEARGGIKAATLGNRIYFVGGGLEDLPGWLYTASSRRIDIYDAEEDTWSFESMQNERINHAVAATGNSLFITGGLSFESFQLVNEMEIFKDNSLTAVQEKWQPLSTSIFPNPFTDEISIQIESDFSGDYDIQLFDVTGKMMYSITGKGVAQVDIGMLPQGVYLLKVFNKKGMVTKRVMKR